MGAPLWLSVIGTALALGIVHVMTGPDHLSALSTLSVGKPLRTAFGLGVRWGCGHSFGLLIVAIIFFAVGQQVDLSKLSYWADLFVGIFMILLGVWYILKAFRERMKYLQDKEKQMNDNDIDQLLQKPPNHNNISNANGNDNYDMDPIDINNENHNEEEEEDQIELQQISNPEDENNIINDIDPSIDIDHKIDCDFAAMKDDKNDMNDSGSDNDNDNDSVSTKENSSSINHPFISNIFSEHYQLKNSYQNDNDNLINKNKSNDNDNDNDIIPDDDIIIDGNASLNPLFDPKEDSQRSKCITRVAAFVAGIFHGIAGPGGVLGVMVALKLNDWFLSSLYLILFFISSIVTMGIYAIIYGYATARMTVCANNKQKCAFILKFVSAIFSLVVGVLWLSLTFNGTLEEWFD